MIIFLFGTAKAKNEVVHDVNAHASSSCVVRTLGTILMDGKEVMIPGGINALQAKLHRIIKEEHAEDLLIEYQDDLLKMLERYINVILSETKDENIIIKVPDALSCWPNKNGAVQNEEFDYHALRNARQIFSQNGAKTINIIDVQDDSIITSLCKKHGNVSTFSARPKAAVRWIVDLINSKKHGDDETELEI